MCLPLVQCRRLEHNGGQPDEVGPLAALAIVQLCVHLPALLPVQRPRVLLVRRARAAHLRELHERVAPDRPRSRRRRQRQPHVPAARRLGRADTAHEPEEIAPKSEDGRPERPRGQPARRWHWQFGSTTTTATG